MYHCFHFLIGVKIYSIIQSVFFMKNYYMKTREKSKNIFLEYNLYIFFPQDSEQGCFPCLCDHLFENRPDGLKTQFQFIIESVPNSHLMFTVSIKIVKFFIFYDQYYACIEIVLCLGIKILLIDLIPQTFNYLEVSLLL